MRFHYVIKKNQLGRFEVPLNFFVFTLQTSYIHYIYSYFMLSTVKCIMVQYIISANRSVIFRAHHRMRNVGILELSSVCLGKKLG